MKKGKRLIILLLVAVLFGAGATLLNLSAKQQEAAKDAATSAAKKVLMTLDADKASALRYTRGGETVELARQDGQWIYAPRAAFALDSAKVKTMLGSLTSVEAVRTVADKSDTLADYGLAEPALRITATADGGAAQTLLVGDKNTTTGNYYAAMEGIDGVYTISSDVYNAFDQSLMGLLTAEAYPTVNANSITGLTFMDRWGQIALEYHPNGDASAYSSAFQWFGKQADGTLTPMDSDAVTAYLGKAAAVTYAGTAADSKADLATYGLDKPNLILTLRYTEAVPQSQAEAAIAGEAAAQAALAALATPATPMTPGVTPTATPVRTATETPIVTATVSPEATEVAMTATPASTAAVATAKPAQAATATPAPTATPAATATATPTATATLTGRAGAALAEGADAVPTASDAPAATPTATPEPTVNIQRTLTVWFGGTDANDNVYMTHSKTDRVFTVSADTFSALAALSMGRLTVTHPAYLSLADITGMTATMGGTTKTVTAETTTQNGSDGTPTVSTVYLMDGQPLKTGAFNLLVGNLRALKAENYTEQPIPDGAQPAFEAVFTQNRAGFETLRVAFYPYDASFMQAEVGTETSMLVNKKDVANLQTYLDGLVAAEPTATPAATAAP